MPTTHAPSSASVHGKAVSAAEIQDAPARDRADEIEAARPLERFGHAPEA
jgi:hypothetical protein